MLSHRQCGLKITSSSHLPDQLQALENILPEVMPFLGQPTPGDQAWRGNKGLALFDQFGMGSISFRTSCRIGQSFAKFCILSQLLSPSNPFSSLLPSLMLTFTKCLAP